MNSTNSLMKQQERLEYELIERPISLGCIVARTLIKHRLSKHRDPKNLNPEALLIDTPIHFIHQAFHVELQSAIAQSKYIHPSISQTLHIKIKGNAGTEKNNGSKTFDIVKYYAGERKIECQAHVVWNSTDRITEICIAAVGGIAAPSILLNCMNTAWQTCVIKGTIISVKYQSKTGSSRSGLEENRNLIQEGILDSTWERAEWIQFRPFWKTDGIAEIEVRKYLYTCTQVVYNRLMDTYNSMGDYESAVPHLVTYVFSDSSIIDAFSCPCNLYKCRGLREIPGKSNRVCPFVGNELHPQGSITYI